MCVYLFIFVTSIFGESVDLKRNLRFQDTYSYIVVQKNNVRDRT